MPFAGDVAGAGFCAFLLAPVAAARDAIVLAADYWREFPLFALVNTVISLAIWAVIGGAVTRMAAVRFAREESVPLKKALCFSLRKWLSVVTSPLIPFGVLVLVAICLAVLAGLPSLIPYAGEVLLGILFFLVLIAGVLMALILVAGLFSVGLQWPTIAAEGSDSFDAISRSVSYVSSRPWRYLFYTIFSTVYGCATFIFVKLIAFLALRIAHTSISTLQGWLGSDKLARMWDVPTLANPWPAQAATIHAEPFAALLISIWVWIVFGLVVAFLVSFFFSSQTVIYFLLRRIVDGTDVEEVYVEEAEEEGLPVEHKVEGPEPPPAESPGAKPEGETGAPPPSAEKK
jgi:hypothetical protein